MCPRAIEKTEAGRGLGGGRGSGEELNQGGESRTVHGGVEGGRSHGGADWSIGRDGVTGSVAQGGDRGFTCLGGAGDWEADPSSRVELTEEKMND